jgi:hypothetical protein
MEQQASPNAKATPARGTGVHSPQAPLFSLCDCNFHPFLFRVQNTISVFHPKLIIAATGLLIRRSGL